MNFAVEHLLLFGNRSNLPKKNVWPFVKEEEQCPSGVFPHQDLSHLPTCPLPLTQKLPPSLPATCSVALSSPSGYELLPRAPPPPICSLLHGHERSLLPERRSLTKTLCPWAAGAGVGAL